MSKDISIEDKKKFLTWFLDHHQLKRRESMWILDYLLNHDIVMNKVHFVENADKAPRGLLMSTIGDDHPGFQFYKQNKMFDNPEQAFHEIRLNWHNHLYIELFFIDCHKSETYLEVLEDNPYHKWNDNLLIDLQSEVTQGLKEFQIEAQKMEILYEIDRSLEINDRERFLSLSEQLNNLETMIDDERTFNEV